MKNERILIVDDEPNIRLMLRSTLKTVGYMVEEAANGREALDAIVRNPPDVMILDLSMPQMDGISVLQKLRETRLGMSPRVIVLTAHGSIPTAVKATRLGAVDFLEKPVKPDEIREAVLAAMREPLGAARAAADPLAGGYAGVLDRVRKSLRLAKYEDAETLIMKAADLSEKDAAYFNLIGVLYEAHHKPRLARKFYGKALAVDNSHEPAQRNFRRSHEIERYGRSNESVCLGDETDVMMARLP